MRRRSSESTTLSSTAIWAAALLSSGCVAIVLAGCGGGSANPGDAATGPTTSTASKPSSSPTAGGSGTSRSGASKQSSTTKNASADEYAPSLFSKPPAAPNRFLPLRPGTQWVRQGTVNVGNRPIPHQVITTVADVSKRIDGVTTVAVLDQDTNGGQIAEQSVDWLAEDAHGNVWNLGSYTESYEGGQFVAAFDAWLGGTNGAKPGILMLADPRTGTPAYSEDTVPGIESPTAQVAATGQTQCVPFKCYRDVLDIQEGGEIKSFAPGVGQIKTSPPASGSKQEVEKLVNLRRLSPSGIKQINKLVLSLDRRARTEAATVYGRSTAARQGAPGVAGAPR